jgi:hypothetical protein
VDGATHGFAVRRDDLLWRTRGRSWDYEFITRPRRNWKDRSYLVTTQVFSAGAGPVPSNIVGLVEGETYLACSVLDPERRDEFGRPVQHYVLWLVPEGALHGGVPEISNDWLLRTMAALRGPLDALFEAPAAPTGEEPWEVDLSLEPSGAPVEHVRGPALKLPKDRGLPVRRRARRRLPVLLLAALLVLAVLLLVVAIS